jgi:predicted small lipoprotein YifL
MNMKRFLALALILVMVFALAACGSSKTPASSSDVPAQTAARSSPPSTPAS